MAAAKGNKYALGNHGGRPAKYETPDELSYQVQLYFDRQEKHTITGLSLFLGFCSRQSLEDYTKADNEFSYIIKRAKLCVENSYEESATPFDIFALKNMGWKDKSDVEHSGEIKNKIIIEDAGECQPLESNTSIPGEPTGL